MTNPMKRQSDPDNTHTHVNAYTDAHATANGGGSAVSRRRFNASLASACAGAAACAVTGFGSSRVLAAEPDPRPTKEASTIQGKTIDIHTHLTQAWNKIGPMTPEMMLRWMDAHRVARSVVLSLVSPESWYFPITTQWVLEQTRGHRDRLIPFCGVDPRSVLLEGYRGFLDILKRYVDAGARGLGEHKWGGAVDDPRNLELLRAATELKLPVLLHMDNVRNTDQPGLPGLEKVLKSFPEGTFIGHAQGFWASISGAVTQRDLHRYPRGPVAAGGALDRLMDKYPNLYGDLSAGSGANAFRRDPEFGRQFLIRRADRLLFGTDYLKQGQDTPQFELIESFDLPDEVKQKIYHDNSAKILGV